MTVATMEGGTLPMRPDLEVAIASQSGGARGGGYAAPDMTTKTFHLTMMTSCGRAESEPPAVMAGLRRARHKSRRLLETVCTGQAGSRVIAKQSNSAPVRLGVKDVDR